MQIGERCAAWSGEKLPYDRELAYLGFNGEQWFDTGISWYGKDYLKAAMKVLVDANSDRCICGLRDTSLSNKTIKALNFSSSAYNVEMAFNSWGSYSDFTWESNVVGEFVIEYKPGAIKLYKEGVVVDSRNGTFDPMPSTLTFYFGALNRNPAAWKFSGRCYYYQMWDANGLVMDYIPVEKDGVGYFYDRVSKTLKASEGRAFILPTADGGGV